MGGISTLSFVLFCLFLLYHHPSAWGRHVTSPKKWIPAGETIRSEMIAGGVYSGKGQEYAYSTYIARVKVDGGEIIQNVLELQDNITLNYNGKEITTEDFELLVYPQGALLWVEEVVVCLGESGSRRIYAPQNMFAGGTDPGTLQEFYICRAWHKNNLVVGKFTGSLMDCEVVDDDGQNRKHNRFDVLVKNNYLESCPERTTGHKRAMMITSSWVPSDQVNVTDLFQVGVEDGEPYFIGRASLFGGTVPGKAKLRNGTVSDFWYTFHGKEYHRSKFEFLVYPPGALTWTEVVTVNNRTCLPENMFQGGVDPRDDKPFYICRAWHGRQRHDWDSRTSSPDAAKNGGGQRRERKRKSRARVAQQYLVVGKFRAESGACEVGYDREQFEYDQFDVLVENGGIGSCVTSGSL